MGRHKTLYIIGNGFDLRHKLKTSYYDYREFLYDKNHYLISSLEGFDYIGLTTSKDLWSSLEENLTLDYESCLYDAVSNFYPNMLDDSDSRWHNIYLELHTSTNWIEDFIGCNFVEWLQSVNDDLVNTKPIFKFKSSDKFITFNYTKTLEDKYGVSESNILHIHGVIDDEESIQFGSIENDSDESVDYMHKEYETDEWYGASIQQGIDEIEKFLERSSKYPEINYDELIKFIGNDTYKRVVVIGHTLNGNDECYYRDIILPRTKNSHWSFYYYRNQIEEKHFCEKYKLNRRNFIK
jgi:hypothetical protein